MKKSLILLALLLVGCPKKEPVVPVPPPEWIEGTCSEWCLNAELLSCPAAKPTRGGASCTTVCENAQATGYARWNLGCRSRAKSCAEADRCEEK